MSSAIDFGRGGRGCESIGMSRVSWIILYWMATNPGPWTIRDELP